MFTRWKDGRWIDEGDDKRNRKGAERKENSGKLRKNSEANGKSALR